MNTIQNGTTYKYTNNTTTVFSAPGLRKTGEARPPCMSPEHNPPSHIVLEPGDYEYTCPSCGRVVNFSVPFITC